MKNAPTIGLYGINGTYNYGCEAIVRGTELILREIWPDATIKYASMRPKDDKKRLKGCNINIIPRKTKSLNYINRLNELLGVYTGFYSLNLFEEDLEWVEDCDAILSIGGDLYTLPRNYKEPNWNYYNRLIHFGEIIKSKNKKFVIWGASIGPFEGYPKTKNVFIKHLNDIDLITSREPRTTRYLKKQRIINNVVEIADPAFFVPAPKIIEMDKNNDKIQIGINLSPLSSIYTFQSDKLDKIIEKQAKLIESLINLFNANIILIPHVVCEFDPNDDDLQYLQKIMLKISEKFHENIKIIDSDIGFIGTKNVLSTCDILIAARMHCAINAISIGIPTIFLSYSDKSYGMAEFIYNDKKWVYNLEEDLTILVNLIKEIISKKESIKPLLNQKINNIKSSLTPLNFIDI